MTEDIEEVMTMSFHTGIDYVHRGYVLRFLVALMKQVLSVKERKLIFLRCGFWVASPLDYRDLANRLKFGTPQSAEACYHSAIQKTRAAIAGSEVESLIIVRKGS